MVELARLERVCGSNTTQGSNPCLSATSRLELSGQALFLQRQAVPQRGIIDLHGAIHVSNAGDVRGMVS